MTRGKLKTGEPFFYVKVDHFVKDRDFATALTAHFLDKENHSTPKLKSQKHLKYLNQDCFFMD